MNSYDKSNYSQITIVDLGMEAQRLLVCRPSEMRPVLAKLEDWMRVLGYKHRDIFAVALALYEAVTNALRHGHHNDPSKAVRVAYLVTAEEVLVQIQDEGAGFNYATEPGPFAEKILERRRGRGLFLMRAYTTWLIFTGEGNRVTFCRRRTSESN